MRARFRFLEEIDERFIDADELPTKRKQNTAGIQFENTANFLGRPANRTSVAPKKSCTSKSQKNFINDG